MYRPQSVPAHREIPGMPDTLHPCTQWSHEKLGGQIHWNSVGDRIIISLDPVYKL